MWFRNGVVMTAGLILSFPLMAVEIKGRLAIFEVAKGVAELCGREDLYQDLMKKREVEYQESISWYFNEGIRMGLTEAEALQMVKLIKLEARERVATQYMPEMRRDRRSTCRAINHWFRIYHEEILGK